MRRLSMTPQDNLLHLKRLMAAQGVDAKTLARDIEMDYTTLTRSLRSKRDFTATEIRAIADYFRISDIRMYFLGG